MKKRVLCVICMLSLLLPLFAEAVPTFAVGTDSVIIEESDLPLRLHYDEEAMYANEDQPTQYDKAYDDGWEKWSLPIGNGYFGANVFGRTETERIQITEKTLSNPYYKTDPEGNTVSLGGLNNFSETYIDIGHPHSEVKNYSRWLDLKSAIAGVSYNYDGVTYTREVFTSYPDKALVIKLDASQSGKLSFVLRPTVPWEQEYAAWKGDRASKTGKVESYVDGKEGVIELSGKMGYYDVDFLGIYRVVTDGGEVKATTCKNEYGESDGTITVSGATSAYIYVVLGSDYELCEEMFTTGDTQKPTFKTDLEYTRKKIEKEAAVIENKLVGKSFDEAYATLRDAHVSDYSELFGRVTLDLGDRADASLTTDKLLEKYKSGVHSRYLETLYFQYGRYLLIASSRPGSLPSNLQGTWNRYNKSPWGSGMWHNINEQMNYWPAFSTNIAETFEAYVTYNQAYMKAAEQFATDNVRKYNNELLGEDGGNGWCIGTGAFPYQIGGDRSAGNLGFTTQLYWEYYQYTQDKAILESIVFPTIISAARYIVKTVELTEDGKYLVSYCDSPEMYVNGVWYYTTGTTYAQSFAYQNNYNALLAAKELGIDLEDSKAISSSELSIFKRLMEQLDKYDPINVGLSGQVKEFREEDYYGSVGDEPDHRHISQLVGLYPGNIINSNTPAWLDAAEVTLSMRGDNAGGWGWGYAHRLNLWARTKNGDRAYLLLNGLLEKCTMTNLWDYGTLFQIDGNLGGTAGITELLLQSHEGYIEPLAALPSAWSSGSYTGLVARGNFEVSAAWENGEAKTFNIKSLSGGEVSVSYGTIGSAEIIRASDGKKISYSKKGTDLITFNTEKGETYIISGFKLSKKLPAPASLTLSRSGLAETELSWTAVNGASGYNVYVAIENQPDYTLVAHTTDTTATYLPRLDNVNARTTFKVIPVNSDGVEGKGVIAYQNPIDVEPKLIAYEAFSFDGDELQVTLKASENTQKYKLWKKGDGQSEYSLVSESPYPIIIHEGYSESETYAISLVSNALRTESKLIELTRIRDSAEGADSESAVWHTNLLEGVKFESGAGAEIWSSSYGYDKLTDGIYDKDEKGNANVHLGRYSSKGTQNAYMDGTATFKSTSLLNEMRIYDFGGASATRLGDEIKVFAQSFGEWKEVYSLSGSSTVTAARVLDPDTQLYYLPIDLSGVRADAVRVYAKNSVDANGITAYEITCSGATVMGGSIYTENMLLGKTPDHFSHDTSLYSGYDQSKLTDGSFDAKSGRYAQNDGINNGFTVEYLLDSEAALDTLKIYDFVEPTEPGSRASSATVELYINGQWEKYLDAKPLLAHDKRATDNHGKYTPIALNGARAEKIRITLKNSASKLGITVYEIMLSGYAKNVRVPTDENILLGKEFIAAEGTNVWGASYGYDKLTDGVYNKDASGQTNGHIGRYSSGSGADERLEGTVQLGGVYELSEMRLYDYTGSNDSRIGEQVRVDAYYAGEWRTVYSKTGYASISSARIRDDSLGLWYLPVDLSGEKAEAIRVYVLTSPSVANVTLYEITCSGTRLAELAHKNIIESALSITVSTGDSDKRLLSSSERTALTDKNANTFLDIGSGSSYSLELDLGGKYSLYTLRLTDKKGASDLIGGRPATRSDDTCVELYIDGEWVSVVKGEALSVSDEYTLFDLYGSSASKIRISFNNTRTFDNGTRPAPVISDIYLTVAGEAPDKKPLLEAYAGMPILADGGEKYNETMQKFREYATEFMLDDATVAAYAKEMWDYNETLLGGKHKAHSIKQYEGKTPNCKEGGWFAYEACEICDYTTYESIVPAGHDLSGEWQHDGDRHWKNCLVCELLDESTVADHVFDTDCDKNCNVCGRERNVTHTYSGDCDSECDICGDIRSTSVAHSGGEATCSERAKCELCGEEYGELAAHFYSDEWKSDETHHWHECACGSRSDEGAHEPDKKSGSCLCGYTVEVKKPISALAIAAIAVGSIVAIGIVGFCVYRFMSKKKNG